MVLRLSSRRIRPSAFWESWFRSSLDNAPEIPWDCAVRLTEAERNAIRVSIREFQLGEQSEGRHLQQAARDYARRSGDEPYSRAVALFIREEQRHAAMLGRFMDLEGIAPIRRAWVDSVFRRLRRFAGLETSICVLLTAEIIAKIYYRALLAATASPALRAICRRILQDEMSHVEFQSERLAILRRGRARWRIAAVVSMQRLLFTGATVGVWVRHRPVLRRGGYSFAAYWLDCHREFSECLPLMDP